MKFISIIPFSFLCILTLLALAYIIGGIPGLVFIVVIAVLATYTF